MFLCEILNICFKQPFNPMVFLSKYSRGFELNFFFGGVGNAIKETLYFCVIVDTATLYVLGVPLLHSQYISTNH